jgi:hypothetical protein
MLKNLNDDDVAGVSHSVDWNNVPDLDPRKAVNNLDNFYSRQLRGTEYLYAISAQELNVLRMRKMQLSLHFFD